MPEGYDPDSPNEVGKLILHDDDGVMHTGLIIVNPNPDATPISVELIPDPIQEEFGFILTVNPELAHFFGALAAADQGQHVPNDILAASNLLWWTSVRAATLMWKEARLGSQ